MSRKKRTRKQKSIRRLSASGFPIPKTASFNIDEAMNTAFRHFQNARLGEARRIFKRILKVEPNHADAIHFSGLVAAELGNNDVAESLLNRAIEINPQNPFYYCNTGTFLLDLGRLDEARPLFQKAIELNPHYADAYNNLGVLFRRQGRLDEAITCYGKVAELNPDYAEAYYHMAIAHYQKDSLDEAIACCRKAVQIKPQLAAAYAFLSDILRFQGKLNEAMSCYDRVLQMRADPAVEVKKAMLLPAVYQSKESIERHRKNLSMQLNSLKNRKLVLEEIDSTSFYLAYHGLNDKQLQEQIGSFYLHVCPDLAWTSPKCRERKSTTDKIEVGIISRFLYDHTIGNLNLGVIDKLSGDKFRTKVFRFSGEQDHISNAIRDAADQMVILPFDVRTARELIAEHRLNILLYLDIGMDPFTYFLAFSRLAPVQCVTWGHPVTTGIPTMDYYLSSVNAEPDNAERHYSERLVLLRRFPMYCYRPELPEELPSREKYGLPEDFRLYACTQTLFKFHPDFDEVVGAILRQDVRGLLVLFEGAGAHRYWTNLLRERFASTFPDVADRVVFLKRLPKQDFLSFLRMCDVILDTLHFNGGYTSLLSFASGTPIVTWPGKFMRGRLTLSFYKQMGVMDCVAENAESYVNIALKLANDRNWRGEISEKIKARADDLFEDIEAVRELECFFEHAVEGAQIKG